MTGAPASLAGQVVTDTGRPLPASAVNPRIVAVSTVVDQRRDGVMSGDPNGLVGADGRFTLSGLTGPVMLKVFGLPPGEAAGLVQSARPDQTGRFRFPSVRPGDYLIAALDYVESWRVGDPEFLEELRRGATKLILREGANDAVALTLLK